MATTLFTIGYAGKDIQQFIRLLQQSHITTLIDVRQLPLSRKRDFSKSNLQEHLEHSGIEYRHLGILGSPKNLREKVRSDNDYQAFFKGYTSYLKTKQDTIEELADAVTQKSACLMCVEPEPTQCHRQIVAHALEKRQPQLKVVHL